MEKKGSGQNNEETFDFFNQMSEFSILTRDQRKRLHVDNVSIF